ncbi:hypothetical protein Tco_0918944, partial [Tanacetum coccineum]
GLQVKQQPDRIFISQDKYVADILKKFEFLSVRTATTPIESNKPLVKDEDGVDVHVRVYRSMIGSLMYLTASKPDIMFAVCACDRFQVTPKASHLNAVKRIFRILISCQCKKQTIVANSTTEAEYVAAANCCGQVLWIQNQMMDYGFNFMNTKIHIDNESTISVIKNHVAHSKTKHIEIRFHFIRDCYEKRLIEVIKIHTNSNVADLLTKGFDVKSFKGEPYVHKDLAFNDQDDIINEATDYMESEDAQDEGRTSSMVLEEKENANKEVSAEAPKGTDKKNEGKSVTQTAPIPTSTPTPTTPTPRDATTINTHLNYTIDPSSLS